MEGDEDLFPDASKEELRQRMPEHLRTNADMLDFLKKAVFYPAALNDLGPIELLKNEGFFNFIYVDYSPAERDIGVFFGKAWNGYECCGTHLLSPKVLLGSDDPDFPASKDSKLYEQWDKSERLMAKKYKRKDIVDQPLALSAEFKKVSGKVKGPEKIYVIYIRSKAFSIFNELFIKRTILPAVLAYSPAMFGEGGDLLRAVFNGGSKPAGFFDCWDSPLVDLITKYDSYKKMGRWIYYYNK